MWTYEQTTGRLFDPAGNFKARGYAGGNCGKNPEGINSNAHQHLSCIGPLPVGFYTLGELIPHHPKLGRDVILLEPDAGNQMFHRGSFRVHGDNEELNQSASEGCMIQPHDVRIEMAQSPDRRLQVVALIQDGSVIA